MMNFLDKARTRWHPIPTAAHCRDFHDKASAAGVEPLCPAHMGQTRGSGPNLRSLLSFRFVGTYSQKTKIAGDCLGICSFDSCTHFRFLLPFCRFVDEHYGIPSESV